MKRLLSLFVALVLALGLLSTISVAEEPVTLSVLTTRQTAGTNDVNDLWWFKYLEQKFNVKFELEQTLETSERISLMFGSGDLPDIIWGITLSTNDAMTYGVQEGMLLSWNDLLTEELMPNAVQAMEDYPAAFEASTAPDGNIYTLPYIKGSKYYDNTGAYSRSVRVYINTAWMEACGIDEMPTTIDELLDVLRTFKAEDPAGLGEDNMVTVDNSDKLKDYIWHSLGFFGATGGQSYGDRFAIKNGEITLPAYSEEAKEFLTFFHTLCEEGLINPDWLTSDKTTRRGWISAGYAGLIGDDTLQYTEDKWADWVGLPLVTSDYCDQPIAAMNRSYTVGGTYASAKTEYPELIASIVDYMYSEEGAMLYVYGPQKGSELEYEGYEGWYYDDNGSITCDPVVRGEVNGQATYVDKMISPCYYCAGRFDRTGDTVRIYAGLESNTVYLTTPDQITGKDLISYVTGKMPTDDNWAGHWNLTQAAAMQGKLTGIILPDVYLSAEDNKTVADIQTIISNHIASESAKFITGARSLDEFDDYMQELRDLGIEEYISIYQEAYSDFIATYFN